MEKRDEKEATPFFVGGELSHYRWAIPWRRLENQPMVTEFLELAPLRKKDSQQGVISSQRHIGSEVIHIIHGNVTIRFPPIEKIEEIPPETFEPDERVHLKVTIQVNSSLPLQLMSGRRGRFEGSQKYFEVGLDSAAAFCQSLRPWIAIALFRAGASGRRILPQSES